MRVSFQFKSKSVNNTLAGFVCVFRHVLAVEIAMTSKPHVRLTLVTSQENAFVSCLLIAVRFTRVNLNMVLKKASSPYKDFSGLNGERI